MNHSTLTALPPYEKRTKLQRLAVFLVTIGTQAAGSILRHLEGRQLEEVLRAIHDLSIIDNETQKKSIREFSQVLAPVIDGLMGGCDFAISTAQQARTDQEATALIERLTHPEQAQSILSAFSVIDPRQIANLLQQEQPQTIAFVAAQLEPTKAAELIKMLPQEQQDLVLEKIGHMEAVSFEQVKRVVASFGRQMAPITSEPHPSGGVKAVAELLNLMGKDFSKPLLARIEERDAELTSAIRRKMFGFEDLTRLQLSDLQRIAREVEMSDLVMALKSSSFKLQEAIFGAVSKRAAQTIKDEMIMLGAVRAREIEAAQDRIIQSVRKLEDEGEISLDGS